MTHDKSEFLYSHSLTAIPGGVNSPVRAYQSVGGTPPFIERALGPYIRDTDGNTYVDMVCTWGPALVGHAHPHVVKAVQEAAEKGLSFGAPTAAEAQLSDAITARVPAAEQVRLVSTGTEATMTAIRLARGFTGRDLLVKFAGCYHGHSDSLLAQAGSGVATQGLPGSAGVPEAIASQTLVVPYNDQGALEDCFARFGDRIAAVITESCPANMGVVPPDPGFNAFIAHTCHSHGALMIIDEVLAGFRCSPSGFWGLEVGYHVEHLPAVLPEAIADGGDIEARTQWCRQQVAECDYVPDIVTFGKVVGGGMPLAALGGRREVMEKLAPTGPVYQAGTLSGNPLATAAGLATLHEANEAAYARIQAVSDVVTSHLDSALNRVGVPHVINRAGSLFSLFMGEAPAQTGVHNYDQARSQDEFRYRAFFHAMLDAGVNLPPSHYEAWFVSSAHDDRAVEMILDGIDSSVEAAAEAEDKK